MSGLCQAVETAAQASLVLCRIALPSGINERLHLRCGSNKCIKIEHTDSSQAFQQLHAKRAETSQNVTMTQGQIAQLKRSIKISELTEEELKGCPEETRMYRSIGRM